MKFHRSNILLLGIFAHANAQCLSSFELTAEHCSYDDLLNSIQEKLNNDAACSQDAATELKDTFGSTEEALKAVSEACSAAHITFGAITNQGSVFDKEYYDGGTYYNEQRQSINEFGITVNRLQDDPGARIKNIYQELAQSNGFTWPGHLTNFEDSCDLNAVMCCFAQDRQAGDNNGNCNTPYDEACTDSDPADNTDVCYVDMERAPTSSRTSQGFAIFEDNDEEDSHCHGFAWSEDPTDSSARFKANKLFFVSMYDHLTQRGYVKSVPGAPMCACVEQMPVVTRADCTQVDIDSETVQFSLSSESILTAEISDLKISFNACQGENGNNNNLASYYERLVNEGKISPNKQELFEKTVVGETYCPEAIDSFLSEQGIVNKPACRYGYPEECGCEEVRQKDYRGEISTTITGKTCQRWDEQTPQLHTRTRKNYPKANLVENYCRNPDNEPGGAWCYTTDENTRWEYCGVPVCGTPPPAAAPKSTTICDMDACSTEEKQADYRGIINKTGGDNPLECQRWDSQSPHSHSRTEENYPESGLEENYCRNPDGEPRAWCYTTDPNTRWAFCDVPRCEGESSEGVVRHLRRDAR